MTETGVVSKVKENGWATVRFDRKAACENCNMCLKPRDNNYVELKLKNTLNAAVGDKVSVSMGNRAVVSASFTVYIVPLIVVAVTLAATYRFVPLWVEMLILAGALAGGFGIVALIDRYIKKSKDYLPRMVEIIKE